jgi:hypothetical protein
VALDPLTAVINLANTLIPRLIKDPTAAAAAQAELDKMQESGDLQLLIGQLQVDAAEAANPNLFVSGWRPALGWICVMSFAYHFFGFPVGGAWVIGLHDIDAQSAAMLISILLTLIGARSFEKYQGVTK